jgi:penicillin G amidase
MRRVLRWTPLVIVAVLLVAGGFAWRLHRRALPTVEGVRHAPVKQRVEIVRDRWGVPHIFAASERDVYLGLGYAVAQDRLFQLELHRRIGQGRLAEMLGKPLLSADRLFRTMDFHGHARRQLAAARPEVQAAFAAYAEGVNAAVSDLGGRLPVELTLLGTGFAPAKADEFVGVVGYMAWTLNAAWDFDPMYDELVAKIGEEKAARLFPYDKGGAPSPYALAAGLVRPMADPLAVWHGGRSSLAGSNTWVVAPSRSTSGHALLANDPHLNLGLPGIWYQAHLHAPGLDVAGVTLPGLPFVIIGHNRRVAWGLTNVMLDGADFFVEKVDGTPPQRVMSRGAWVDLGRRTHHIAVKGEAAVAMDVLETPHGPLVNHLLEKATRPISYRWNFAADTRANEAEGVYMLSRAQDWPQFREALSHLGGIAQNISYADVDGHIGLQMTGSVPRRAGRWDGHRFRVGSDGSEEWDGFVPFADLPHSYDPPQGWLAAANNVTFPPPAPFFVSAHWEPTDRITRIREVLAGKPRLSLDDMKALHADVKIGSWPALREALRSAFPSPPAGTAGAALARVLEWDGAMTTDSTPAAIFAAFLERLFPEIAGDELGPDLTKAYRNKDNVWVIMAQAALAGGAAAFIDDVRTPETEDASVIVRRAFEGAVADLNECCGADPARWNWGSRHQFELRHPLAAGGPPLRAYFNRGPYPAAGHSLTVNKGEFGGESYAMKSGPSMRQLVDMGRVHDALAVIPAGQSGIPASSHYDDQVAPWLAVEYHPLLMDRSAIDAVREGTLVLEP